MTTEQMAKIQALILSIKHIDTLKKNKIKSSGYVISVIRPGAGVKISEITENSDLVKKLEHLLYANLEEKFIDLFNKKYLDNIINDFKIIIAQEIEKISKEKD